MKTSTTAGSPTKVDDPELDGWVRGAPKPPAAGDSPAKEPRGERRAGGDSDFITRSTIKRDPKPEENKERGFGGPKRDKPEEPAGFSRGNFKSKREEEAPKRDGPPRFSRGEKRDSEKKPEDSGAGFGFRSNPKGRGGKK